VKLPIYVADAFASEAFKGNPAGVCPLDDPLAETLMLSIAAEMKHAETAFLVRRGPAEFDLRWFTPAAEVDLCGHATLASAHVLWEIGAAPKGETITFHTKSGALTAAPMADMIQLDFPAEPVDAAPLPSPLSFIGKSVFTGKNRLDWFVQLEDEDQVRAVQPDFDEINSMGLRGLVVTAQGRDYDIVSRFFAPQVGVPEDPVTGSAHCGLLPFWAERLGKKKLTAYQASERGGELELELSGNRSLLRGTAVTVLQGQLTV
jgi:predicted PhzF superfamily epimerase YddE/YHI9